MLFLSPLLLLLLLLLADALAATGSAALAASSGGRTHVCVSSYTTGAELEALPWAAVTDLVQSVAPLSIGAGGNVSAAAGWPMGNLVATAHAKSARIWVGVKTPSKDASAAFLRLPRVALGAAAEALVKLVAAAGYDGFQVDIEGLKPESKEGLEFFLAAAAEAAEAHGVRMSSTLYALVVLQRRRHPDAPSAYNASRLASFGDGVFLMGYDLSWLGSAPGTGWESAAPCAPIDALDAMLSELVHVQQVDPKQLVLGLPLYGRVYVCDGSTMPVQGNCSCATRNFKKKSLDLLVAVPDDKARGCTVGYNNQTATPYWECPRGSGLPGVVNPEGLREQAWFENPASFDNKTGLARKFGLAGVGTWTAHGIGGGTSFDTAMWEVLQRYARTKRRREY